MVNKKFENIKKKSRIFIKCVPILGLLLGQKADKVFFVQSQFYRCTDFHATYKLSPAGTLRFAQSPLRGLAIKHNVCVCMYVRVYIFFISPHKLLMLERK